MSSSVSSLSSTLCLPAIEPEAGGGEVEHARRVDVADQLQRVLGLVGDFVDVDEERVQVVGGPDVAAADEDVEPPLMLQLRVDPPELQVEQLIVVAELEQLRVGELEDLEHGLRRPVRCRRRARRSRLG